MWTELNLIHEAFAVETSLAFLELSVLVTAPQTLAQAEAGKKQGLSLSFCRQENGAHKNQECNSQA